MLCKKKLDVLREMMAGGSFLCHSLTRARRCEVTGADRVTLGASDAFGLGEPGSPFCGESGVGAEAGLSGKKMCHHVCEEPPAPTSRAQSGPSVTDSRHEIYQAARPRPHPNTCPSVTFPQET